MIPHITLRGEVGKALGGPAYIIAWRHVVRIVIAPTLVAAIKQVASEWSSISYVWAARYGNVLEKYEWKPAVGGEWVRAKVQAL